MGWYYKVKNEPPPHIHDCPAYAELDEPQTGDLWECSCGDLFMVLVTRQELLGERIVWSSVIPEDHRRNVQC